MLFVFTSSRYHLVFNFLPSNFLYMEQMLMLMLTGGTHKVVCMPSMSNAKFLALHLVEIEEPLF
jgi:hypothetical protein